MADPDLPRDRLVRQISLGRANAFLIRGTRPVLVDTGLPGNAPKILAVLREEGYDPRDLGLVVITHVHTDHFGSVAAVAAETGAPVLVHADEAGSLAAGNGLQPVPASRIGRIFSLLIGKETPHPELAVDPAYRVTGPYRLDAFGIDGEVVPAPGHTRGSLAVRLATGEYIVGDLLMGLFPAHHPRFPVFAEDMGALAESVRRMIALRPGIVYTGHGGPFTLAQLESLGV